LDTATVPQTVRVLLERFRSCFTRPGFKNFVPLVIGWIICQGRHSISRVIQAAKAVDDRKHHSCLYRFLSQGRWSTDAVGQVLFRLLLPFAPAEVTVILDDTLSHKSGPHIFGAAMHYDAHRSTYGRGTAAGRKGFFAFGLNWVVAALWIRLPWGQGRGLAVPILLRLYRSKKRCPERKYRKRTEIGVELISLLVSWLPEGRRLHIVADAEYACRTIVRQLPDNVAFTGPMAMDAALYAQPTKYRGRGRPQRKGKRLPSPKKLASSRTPWKTMTAPIYGKQVIVKVKMTTCLWYTVAGTKLVRMIVTRDPTGRIADRAYFTTDCDSSAEAIIAQFARRWEIEVAFRNAKQALGIQDPQNGWWRRPHGSPRPKKRPGPNPRERVGQQAVNHTLAIAFVAYALTIVHYLTHGDAKRDVKRHRAAAPWYTHKSIPSFHDMLAALRRELWLGRLSQHPRVILGCAEIDAILPHWHLAA
jgi:hypothetical protein